MLENSVKAQPESTNGASWHKWGIGIFVVLLLSVVSWVIISRNQTKVDLPPVISNSEFEALTGTQISLIAVTGGGGFVDFRVRVIDAEKATAFFADTNNAPYLVVEESGVQLAPPADAEFNVELEERGYFMLYANANNAVQQGTLISVVVGDVRLEAIPAQ